MAIDSLIESLSVSLSLHQCPCLCLSFFLSIYVYFAYTHIYTHMSTMSTIQSTMNHQICFIKISLLNTYLIWHWYAIFFKAIVLKTPFSVHAVIIPAIRWVTPGSIEAYYSEVMIWFWKRKGLQKNFLQHQQGHVSKFQQYWERLYGFAYFSSF